MILFVLKPIIQNLKRRKCDHINDQLKAVFLKEQSGGKQEQAYVLTGHKIAHRISMTEQRNIGEWEKSKNPRQILKLCNNRLYCMCFSLGIQFYPQKKERAFQTVYANKK